MRDIHSHILFEIDDGAFDVEESVEIIKQAISNKYTDIVLTPHYRKYQKYTASNKVKVKLFSKLLEKVEEENLKINLYLGNEITVDEDLFYYLKTNQVLTLNNSKYILLELPFVGRLKYLDETLEELIKSNYIPIIVHPERYKDYKEKDFLKWINNGILFQGNIESLYNKYGKRVNNKLSTMLKKHMIHFMGSDIHRMDDTTYEKDIKNKLKDLVKDDKMVLDLIENNTYKVINNLDIKPYEIKIKKKFKMLKK